MLTSDGNRRRVFVLGLVLAPLVFINPPLGALSPLVGLYRVEEVKPNVFVWIPDDVIDQECDPLFTRPATAGFVLTTDGVVVIDTTNSPMQGRDLLYEIRHRTELPIHYVINTSSAGDHMLGNEVFSDEEATLISTRAAQEEMLRYRQELFERQRGEAGYRLQARMRGFHVTPSTETFDDTMTLNLGGQDIRMSTLMRGETSPGEAVVYLPTAKTLFLGELFCNRYFPRIGTRNVRRWIEALRQVESWDAETFVPGHGVPGGKKDVADFRKFLEWLVAQVDMRLKKGQTPEDVQKSLWLPKTYNWHAPDWAQDTVADVCRQLAPPGTTASPAQPAGH